MSASQGHTKIGNCVLRTQGSKIKFFPVLNLCRNGLYERLVEVVVHQRSRKRAIIVANNLIFLLVFFVFFLLGGPPSGHCLLQMAIHRTIAWQKSGTGGSQQPTSTTWSTPLRRPLPKVHHPQSKARRMFRGWQTWCLCPPRLGAWWTSPPQSLARSLPGWPPPLVCLWLHQMRCYGVLG